MNAFELYEEWLKDDTFDEKTKQERSRETSESVHIPRAKGKSKER